MTRLTYTQRNAAIAMLIATCTTAALADVPRQFNFQGRIAGGGTGQVDLVVTLWDASTGGTALYTETHNNVTMIEGVFSIRVGSIGGGVPTSAAIPPVFIGLAVNGNPELTPRTRLVSVPFAYRALDSESLVIPGTTTTAVGVNTDGQITVDQRVQMGAQPDAGGILWVYDDTGATTVKIDGEDQGSGGARVELANGAATNRVTLALDANDGSDSRIDLYDSNGYDAFRLHSDLTNNAPEFSMFINNADGTASETVQIQANFDADSAGAGEVRLRRSNGTEVTTTVQLKATSDNAQDLPLAGGELILSHSDGSPVFTVHAGDGASALSPSWIEFRNANDVRRLYATTTSLSYYNINNDQTIFLGAANGDATFDGEVSVGVLNITGGSDLSEKFEIRAADGAVEPGMVVSIDPAHPGHLVISSSAYDRTVAGVISGAGGVKPGMLMSQTGTLADGKLPVALTGRVWVLCDATEAAITPGDLLTSAPTPGHAMKAADTTRAPGATLGKAMTPLAAGQRGLVLVLVNLQ